MAEVALGPSEPRIVRKHPENNWKNIWTNLHTTGLTNTLKSTWYIAIHDLIPTNDRLAAIHLTDTHYCIRCGQPDSLQHIITDCRGSNHMELDARETRADTPYGPAALTTDMAAPTRLSLMATASTGSPCGTPSFLPSADSPPPLTSGLHGFSSTGSLESTSADGKEPEHRQISECTLMISTPEPH